MPLLLALLAAVALAAGLGIAAILLTDVAADLDTEQEMMKVERGEGEE